MWRDQNDTRAWYCEAVNDIELGWLAGVFEGEGCLSLARTYGKRIDRWWAGVVMSDEDVMHRFHQLIGVGTITGPYTRTNRPTDKPLWKWQIAAQEDVLNFCALMQPYMGERRAAKMAECIGDLTS